MTQIKDPVSQGAGALDAPQPRFTYVKQRQDVAAPPGIMELSEHWTLYLAGIVVLNLAFLGIYFFYPTIYSAIDYRYWIVSRVLMVILAWRMNVFCAYLTGLLIVILEFYHLDIRAMSDIWRGDASWSHGFLVPVFAAFFVYLQWDRLKQLPIRGSIWGLVLLIFGVFTHVLFLTTGQFHMSEMSLLVVGLGLVLFLLGQEHLKLLWMPICFLIFMIPPPSALYVKLTQPMQFISAEAGVRLLPLFGITAERQGTQVMIFTRGTWESLNVVEACSGVRMLMAFLALAVALAYTTSRPIVQKLFLAGSAIPIAIFCNALRVTVIGLLFATASRDFAHGSTHEYIGLLMLGPAMALQLGLAWILDKSFIEIPASPSAAGGAS